MPERTATVASRVGLHARPAAIFAEAAGEYDLDITIAREGEPADEAMDAASILSLMSLGASHGDVVVLRAEGTGADDALESLVQILETDHDAVSSGIALAQQAAAVVLLPEWGRHDGGRWLKRRPL